MPDIGYLEIEREVKGLRFVERDGQRILQHLVWSMTAIPPGFMWIDVPLEQEYSPQ